MLLTHNVGRTQMKIEWRKYKKEGNCWKWTRQMTRKSRKLNRKSIILIEFEQVWCCLGMVFWSVVRLFHQWSDFFISCEMRGGNNIYLVYSIRFLSLSQIWFDLIWKFFSFKTQAKWEIGNHIYRWCVVAWINVFDVILQIKYNQHIIIDPKYIQY